MQSIKNNAFKIIILRKQEPLLRKNRKGNINVFVKLNKLKIKTRFSI